MKSPWLPPKSTGEQCYACIIVIFGAMIFAAFLGNVTTMVQSYEKSNSLYRDQMGHMHNLSKFRPVSKTTHQSLLAYADAYFKASGTCSRPSARLPRPCHVHADVHADDA